MVSNGDELVGVGLRIFGLFFPLFQLVFSFVPAPANEQWPFDDVLERYSLCRRCLTSAATTKMLLSDVATVFGHERQFSRTLQWEYVAWSCMQEGLSGLITRGMDV